MLNIEMIDDRIFTIPDYDYTSYSIEDCFGPCLIIRDGRDLRGQFNLKYVKYVWEGEYEFDIQKSSNGSAE